MCLFVQDLFFLRISSIMLSTEASVQRHSAECSCLKALCRILLRTILSISLQNICHGVSFGGFSLKTLPNKKNSPLQLFL